jgi:signal peptidase I
MNTKNNPSSDPQKPKTPAFRFLRGVVREVIIPIIMAIVVIQFVIQAFKIPSGSMEDSLLVGDFLLGLKFAYGSPIPFSDEKFPGYTSPKPGDVMIFSYPGEPLYPDYDKERYSHLANLLMLGNYYWDHNPGPDQPRLIHFPDGPKDFIKRCVAMSGQTVQVKNGRLWVNGAETAMPGKGKYTSAFRTNTVRDNVPLTYVPSPGDTIRLDSLNVLEAYRMRMLILQENPDDLVGFELVLKEDSSVVDEYFFRRFLVAGTEHSNVPFSFFRQHAKQTFIPLHPPVSSGFRRTIGYQFFDLSQIDFLQQNIERANETDTTHTLHLEYKITFNGKALQQYVVQKPVYYMMGDNRDNSSDSRYWGYLSENNVKAKAFITYFSFDNSDGSFALFNPFSWFQIPFKIRWSRIAKLIHGL